MKNKQLTHSYSNNIQNKRVAVLGLVPPPLGGIAVHVQRVIHKLKMQNNDVLFMHTENPWYLLPFFLIKTCFLLLYFRPHVVMYHSVYLRNSLLQLYLLFFVKKILKFKLLCIEHNCRHMYKRSGVWRRFFNKIVKSVDTYIFIGTSTYQSYKDNGIKVQHYSIESAFLPPNLQDEELILKTYPTALNLFLQQRKPLLLVNAFQLVLLEGNKDLYGIDQSIELLHELKKQYPSVGLVFALAKVGNATYFEQLQCKIKAYDLKDNIFVLTGQKELWPLFKRVDVFLRPTLSDGASVSIEEALYFEVPVVASNVVVRQQGVELFDPSKASDFLEKIMYVFDSHKKSFHKKQLYFDM